MEKKEPPLQKRDHTWKVCFARWVFLIGVRRYKPTNGAGDAN